MKRPSFLTSKSLISVASASLVVLGVGCGYGLQNSGTVLPPEVKTVAILPVENLTTENALGLRLQSALQERFERYGVVSVVDKPGGADAILTAKVKSVDSRVRNVSDSRDIAIDNNVTLTVAAELKKRDGQILWRDEDFRLTNSFASVSSAVVTSSADFAQGGVDAATLAGLNASPSEIARGQRTDALENLIQEAARQIYNNAVAPDF